MSEAVSMCKKGMMSTCSSKKLKEQEKCKFYEKATHEHRCMYFIFDKYCDCLKAHEYIIIIEDKTKKLQEENQKKIDEEAALENEKQETIIPT